MTIAIQLALLIAGFVLLVKGADWFVEGASGIAEKTGLSQMIIGLTIVAMGTSAPEAAISITSAAKGSAGIAVGNVLGSNIMNIMLILGITALVVPLAVQKSTIKIDIPFVVFITILTSILGLCDHVLGRTDGVILWVIFIGYLSYLIVTSLKGNRDKLDNIEDCKPKPEACEKPKSTPWLIIMLVFGAVMIVLGSNLTVDAATNLAKIIGISDRVIGLTIVAFGTSLPELVTCIAAGIKNKADIAIGNIVGSNIFNLLFVLGTSALIIPIPYHPEFLLDSIICAASVVLLWICTLNQDHKLKRWGGVLLLLGYAAYFIQLVL